MIFNPYSVPTAATPITIMKLLLTARSANSGRFQRQNIECVDWDENGGFRVTPTCKSSNKRRTWRGRALLSFLTPKSYVADPKERLSRRNIQSKPASTSMSLQNKQPHQQQQYSRRRRQFTRQQNVSSRSLVQLRPRRTVVEQIPAEMRVTLVYGGDSATVATCTTGGRTSIKTEPDALTKRTMANVILRQLLDEDERTKICQRQPVEPQTSAPSGGEHHHYDDDKDVEQKAVETPAGGIFHGVDSWFSCCAGSSAVPLSPTSTVDQTMITESSGYSSWWTHSYESSGISSTTSW